MQTTSTVRNAQGLVSSATNALGKATSYAYDAYGDVLSVTDPAGNRVVSSYDVRGHKLSSSDPDMGLWRYSHDVLGELLSQTDAKGQAASFVAVDGSPGYDAPGRVLRSCILRTQRQAMSSHVALPSRPAGRPAWRIA